MRSYLTLTSAEYEEVQMSKYVPLTIRSKYVPLTIRIKDTVAFVYDGQVVVGGGGRHHYAEQGCSHSFLPSSRIKDLISEGQGLNLGSNEKLSEEIECNEADNTQY